MAVVVETTIGDFTVDLFTEERPQTCKNFLKLCKLKYYNLSLFHTVQANFVAQTGDPTGSGNGGESIFGIVYGPESRYYEAEKMPKIKHVKPGLLSMVNCGNNMLGSQFLITLGSELQSLDEHCVFGEVAEGHDVLVKLNEAITDFSHRPYQDIRITHTVILQDPFDDLPGMQVPSASPDLSQLPASNGMLAADEVVNEDEGVNVAEVQEAKAEQEAKARATILEIIGDLPHADVAPPENVLFVCKLNPVTTDDDLEIIFSRFGKVNSCEVIRDHVTGDSLQYAFVEFAERRACEQAYAKMDNVLIDDRRIHVDFSQSVSKIRWKGKGRGVELVQTPNSEDGSRGSSDGRFNRRDINRDTRRDDRRREDDDRRRGGDDRRRRNDDLKRIRGYDRKDEVNKRKDDKKRGMDKRKEDFTRRKDDHKRRRDQHREFDQHREVYNHAWEDGRGRRQDIREREVVEEEFQHRREYIEESAVPLPQKENGNDRGDENGNEQVHTLRPTQQQKSPEQLKEQHAKTSSENKVESEEGPAEVSSKKTKRKRRKRDSSSSSSSSSDSSSSTSTSSSSSSSSSDDSRRPKKKLIKKKYYDHKGKLVKVVKTRHDSSSSSDSDSDRKHRKRKHKKKVRTKKIIQVIKGGSDDDDDDDSDSEPLKTKSKSGKKKKKKREKSKKGKRRKASESSSSEESDELLKKKPKSVATKEIASVK